MSRTSSAALVLLWLSQPAMLASGCGASEGPPASRPVASPAGDTETNDPSRDAENRPDPRALSLGARFGDLVRSARELDDRNLADATEQCVLQGEGPYHLLADVAVAIRPLPDAPEDLDALLVNVTSARLFTRWGQVHQPNEGGGIAVTGFTGTPPPARAEGAAIFLTDQGIYVRPAGVGAAHGPLPFTEGVGAARATVAASAMTLVSAEAGVSLSTLRDLLRLLPLEAHGRVALGVTLPPDVTLPAPDIVEEDDGRGLCPDGLPAPAGAPGELQTDAIIGALGPLREGATRCMGIARGPGAGGSRVDLAMRIGPDGHLIEACIIRDSAAAPELRDCLLEAARATVFPIPSPAGFVDAELPLILAPDPALTQALICP